MTPSTPPDGAESYAAASKRHPATAKAWEWFETDKRALALSDELRNAIRERLEDLDADFIEWDAEAKS